jgi:hypothetical protein
MEALIGYIMQPGADMCISRVDIERQSSLF